VPNSALCSQKALWKCNTKKIYTSGPIYRKMYAVQKEKVHSIARPVLDRSALSALDLEVYAQSHSTAPISHSVAENGMA
jgi:hypothetical protein